ncbi:MAG: hypothetical protein KA473_11295 [Anaerolineales bacterium]|nr:hypothetical protein [Anaerolineales bacterium]
MSNEPRVYRQSSLQVILMIVAFSVLGIGLVISMAFVEFQYLLLALGVLGVTFTIALYSQTLKTIISDSEISTQSLLGVKSLRWTEISRVTGSGNGIKLHNFDGDVTLAPSTQLPGYEEIVETIGSKRPDLFDPLEYKEMKKSWPAWATIVIFAIFFIGMILGFIFAFINTPNSSAALFLPAGMSSILLIVFLGVILSAPQAVTLNGNSLLLTYLFKEKTVLADEVSSVSLSFIQTRNGKNYFVQLNQRNKKTLKISSLGPGLPILYLVLKNWHAKNSKLV